MKEYKDPYAEVAGPTKRLSLNVPEETFHKIHSVRLVEGTTQITLALLVSKLENLMNQYGIETYKHQSKFEQLLANSTLVVDSAVVTAIFGVPVNGVNGQTGVGNVPSGVGEGDNSVAATPKVSANVASVTGGGPAAVGGRKAGKKRA